MDVERLKRFKERQRVFEERAAKLEAERAARVAKMHEQEAARRAEAHRKALEERHAKHVRTQHDTCTASDAVAAARLLQVSLEPRRRRG